MPVTITHTTRIVVEHLCRVRSERPLAGPLDWQRQPELTVSG